MIKRAPRATIDFETRSAANIKKTGGWRYSKDPSTRVMCLCYKLPTEEGVKRWYPDWMADEAGVERCDPPEDLFAWIEQGGLVEAHNVLFELAVWLNVCQPQHGWPDLRLDRLRCSAAKAAAFSLPRDLDGATKAVHLKVTKDLDGKNEMLKLSKPRKPLKAERDRMLQDGIDPKTALLWERITPERLDRLLSYCDDDVLAEEALSEYLPDLLPQELRVFQADMRIHLRGIPIDAKMARGAVKIAEEAKRRANEMLNEMTGGLVERATQRQRFKDWMLEHQGVDLPDTTADTIDVMLEAVGDLGDHVPRIEHEDGNEEDERRVAQLRKLARSAPRMALRALKCVRDANRTAAAKYQAALGGLDPDDGRIRDVFMYHGASTGRWTSKLLQVHNLARGNPPEGWNKKDWASWGYDLACEAIATGDIEWLATLIGVDVLDVLRTCVRGIVVASKSRKLAPTDYAAIEARVLLWLAGATAALQVFERGEDIYCDLAAEIYGRKITKADAEERQLGKQGILGLGFGMGAPKFLITLRKYNISFTEEEVRRIVGKDYERIEAEWLAPPKEPGEEPKWARAESTGLTKWDLPELVLCTYVVEAYRRRYPEVVQFWRDIEDTAIMATENKGFEVRVGKSPIIFKFIGRFLHMRLPSGRTIKYCEPRIKPKKTPWGEWKDALHFMGVDAKTKRWVLKNTYSGMLTENGVQGCARDFLAHAMVAIELDKEAGPDVDIVLHVHDEGVPEVDSEEQVSVVERVMTKLPDWAPGFPLAVEGAAVERYRK